MPFPVFNSVPCCGVGRNEHLAIYVTLTGKLYVIWVMQTTIPSNSFLLTWKPRVQVLFIHGSALNSGINHQNRSTASKSKPCTWKTLGVRKQRLLTDVLPTTQENWRGRDRGFCHTSAEGWMAPKIYLLDDEYKWWCTCKARWPNFDC